MRQRFLAMDIEMLAALAFEASGLNHVPQMRNHARLDETLAVFIEVNAPRIARTFCKHFENMLGGMIPPHAGVHALAFFLRRAGFADERRAKHAVTTIEPAIGSPGEIGRASCRERV